MNPKRKKKHTWLMKHLKWKAIARLKIQRGRQNHFNKWNTRRWQICNWWRIWHCGWKIKYWLPIYEIFFEFFSWKKYSLNPVKLKSNHILKFQNTQNYYADKSDQNLLKWLKFCPTFFCPIRYAVITATITTITTTVIAAFRKILVQFLSLNEEHRKSYNTL